MAGQVGGGQVSLSGSIAYKPSLQFNLALQGNPFACGIRKVYGRCSMQTLLQRHSRGVDPQRTRSDRQLIVHTRFRFGEIWRPVQHGNHHTLAAGIRRHSEAGDWRAIPREFERHEFTGQHRW